MTEKKLKCANCKTTFTETELFDFSKGYGDGYVRCNGCKEITGQGNVWVFEEDMPEEKIEWVKEMLKGLPTTPVLKGR